MIIGKMKSAVTREELKEAMNNMAAGRPIASQTDPLPWDVLLNGKVKIMYKKIIIPLDNSATDETILVHIRKLAQLTQAQLVLVHVADGFAARLQDQLNLADSEEIKDDQAAIRKTEKSSNM